MEKMIFTLTEQMKDAIQLLQRTVTNKKVSGGVYPEGVLFYKDNLAAVSADLCITYKLTADEIKQCLDVDNGKGVFCP